MVGREKETVAKTLGRCPLVEDQKKLNKTIENYYPVTLKKSFYDIMPLVY